MAKSIVLMLSLWAGCLFAVPSPAAQFDLAALSCDKYENEIVGSAPDASQAPSSAASSAAATQRPDAIDTVMWLFGFSVAAAGDHMMYGDALAQFGFALDAECKNHPTSSLLQAVTSVKPNRDKPMDLTVLNCAEFESRHAESARSDAESANTIMMWLFGFSVGLSGSHIFDSGGVKPFAAALQTRCSQNPNDSLFQSLSAVARPAAR
ncbi:MAG TPA: HdeA/HdeB family chaperone [Steroidobacteraceae bacterium]|jgi:hypothetical protein|nr:HdeA/HdeB family chaperone [Steroidobacteraceae bacterium]